MREKPEERPSNIPGRASSGRKYGILIPDDPDCNGRINNAASTKLTALLTTGMIEFGYVYGFGDHWKHRIFIGGINAAEAGASYPRFLGGDASPMIAAARQAILSSSTSPLE